MSNTRKAKEGLPLRQERFMSSPEYERGLMANMVARRCEKLDDPSDRELIWFLQLLSRQDGGLKAVADELWRRWPERLATNSMIEFGTRPGKRYDEEQVRKIRGDAKDYELDDELPLRGDESLGEYVCSSWREKEPPTSYTVEQVRAKLRDFVGNLPKCMEELCQDPACDFTDAWYFYDLRGALRDYQADRVKQHCAGTVITQIGRQVNETLDYCLESRRLVLIDGLARTGKTFAAKAWCEAQSGRARYAQVPSTNDDIAFFRAIARSLGVSINLNSKAHHLRDRIEDTLQRARLMMVFDEAHYLWPQGNYREALPARLNWIMTALVNHGVPVALVTTPQFMRSQKRVEAKTCWTSEQFIGRIGHYERLPDSLAKEDLEAVARMQLPEGDGTTLEMLAAYAGSSAKYLAGIETVVSRARFLAGRDGRAKVQRADIKRAIQEGVIPSDNALSTALTSPASKSLQGRRSRLEMPLQLPAMRRG
jgi:hypothetical protein